MTTHKKFKIVLLQLPVPEYNFRKKWGSVPLAALYLKAMAHREGLLNEVELEILGEKEANRSSDARLIDLIVSKSPDLVGFSIYVWNGLRSLHIAEEVKKRLPRVKILVGGQEVTLQTQYLLENPVVDIGCLGEGELPFIEIVKRLLKGEDDYAGIPGLFYRKSGQIVTTAPNGPIIQDLNQIPSPFALGFITLSDFRVIIYETLRGCPFKCSFCETGLIKVRRFSPERVCEDLKIILESGVEEVRLIDSDFLLYPSFFEICEGIKKINGEKKLRFSCFTYGEHVTEEKAKLIKECNFTRLEIGLQSVNSETLKNTQRQILKEEKFVQGVRRLEERDIGYGVDLIIGLPGDALEGFKRTLNFLKENRITKNVLAFVLLVMPGTVLRKDAARFGIRYQDHPPYRMIDAPYISREAIEEAISLAPSQATDDYYATHPDLANDSYLRVPKVRKRREENFFESRFSHRVDKVILDLDASIQQTEQLERAGKRLQRIVGQPFRAYFKGKDLEREIGLMRSFIAPIAEANPFLLWEVILEGDRVFPVELIGKIKESIRTREKLFICSRNLVPAAAVTVIWPWKNNAVDEEWLHSLRETASLYRSYKVCTRCNWKEELAGLVEADGEGILIDFEPNTKLGFMVEVLQFLHQENRPRRTLSFRNLVVRHLSDFIAEAEEFGKIQLLSPELNEFFLWVDREFRILAEVRPDDETVMDSMEGQIKTQKFLVKLMAHRARSIAI